MRKTKAPSCNTYKQYPFDTRSEKNDNQANLLTCICKS